MSLSKSNVLVKIRFKISPDVKRVKCIVTEHMQRTRGIQFILS